MAPLSLTALSSLTVSTHQIPAHALIPNTSISHKALLIYHSCFPPTASASAIEAHLKATGVVVPQWRYTMYRFVSQPQAAFPSTSSTRLTEGSG
jgi:hypothetical protein